MPSNPSITAAGTARPSPAPAGIRMTSRSRITGRSNHWVRREATHNDLFRDIFIKPGICCRCRQDESLGAIYGYGKNRIERLFWRELVEAETPTDKL